MRPSERPDDLSTTKKNRSAVPTASLLASVLNMLERWRRSTKHDISHRLSNMPNHAASVIAEEPPRMGRNLDSVYDHSITEVDIRVMIATPQLGLGVDRPPIVIDDVNQRPARTATELVSESTSDLTPPTRTEPNHLPLDMILLLFNRYDELARSDRYIDLDSATIDDEVWLDLVEGPAARFVDQALSSPTHHTIRLVTGETIRRVEETASWDVDLVEGGRRDEAAPGQPGLVIDLDVFAIDTVV